MSHIVITQTGVKMVITYNDQSENNEGWTVKNINRRCISEANVLSDTSIIEISLRTGVTFHLDYTVVDTVDGVVPTDKTHLADLISDLIL
jgi:hypothetical protein